MRSPALPSITPRSKLIDPILAQELEFADHIRALVRGNEAATAAIEEHLKHQRRAIGMLGDYEAVRDSALGILPFDDRIGILLEGTRSLMEAQIAAVLLFDLEEGELWPRASSGYETAAGVKPVPVEGKLRLIVDDAKSLLIDHLTNEGTFTQGLLDEGIQSVVAVPLRGAKSVHGVLLCGHPGRGAFLDKDAELLQLVGDRMAAGFDRVNAVHEDAKARRRAESERKQRTDLLQMATHDLRTPLTAILMQLRLLQDHDVEPAQLKKSAAMIERNVARLSSLLDDFLDLARVEADRLTIIPKRFDVGQLLKAVEETFAEQARQSGLSLEVTAPRGLVGLGDERRVLQVVSNLVSNAIRYSDKGTIRVTAEPLHEHVAIHVVDEGIGLSKDQIDRLFAPFTQVHEGRKGAKGNGLGLYLSKSIAKAHGGDITISSTGPGKGAKATLTLPHK